MKSYRLRTVLPVAVSGVLALTGTCLVLASPGEAAPLPTTYSARSTSQLWHVNSLDTDLTDTDPASTRDLTVFRATGLVSSTGTPRSHAEADNLAGDDAIGQSARRTATSDATQAHDTGAPTAGVAPAGTVASLVSVGQTTLGARGRWAGDSSCLTTADGLADATTVGGGASLPPQQVPAGGTGLPIVLPSELATLLPSGSSGPSDVPSGLPTSLPSDVPTGLPTGLPSGLPSELPSGLPRLPLPTGLPTELPTVLPPFPRPATPAADGDGVVLAALAPGTVQTRSDLPLQNEASGDVRGVRAQAIGSVKDTSAPAMTFFDGEVELRISREARLTAFADGVHPSAVVWAPPTVTLAIAGQPTTYAVPADGTPVAVSYSGNSDVTLTVSAGQLASTVHPGGLTAIGTAAVAHLQIKDAADVVMDADFMAMTAEAKSPGGGLECPPPDTDGDGLSDALEAHIHTNPGLRDSDHDGLTDGQEYLKYKTNPLKADTDSDKLKDGLEVKKYKTNPRKADTDRDKLSDGQEVRKYRTKPLKADTDKDHLKDGVEVRKY
ncbi:MAG: Peptidoglycan-associated outer membrane protein, partial [Nocardioides sp.]|nr:Peptidoglycan-associated outer membrane protein [Nocardioides sp.]